MSTNTENPKDILAIVKFEHQVLLAELDMCNYDNWIKTVTDLVPVPVEIHLISKGQSLHDEGIVINNQESLTKMIAAAEEARKNKYVLRLVLHRLPKEVKTKNSSLTSDIEMKKEKPRQKSLPLALQKGSSFPTAFDNAGGASYACQACGECPKWAAEIKAELLGLIEDKFNVLTTKIDDKLSQISQSASYTESLCSMNTDLLSICSGKSAAGSEGSKGFQMVSSKDLVERKTGESGSCNGQPMRTSVHAEADLELEAALAYLRALNLQTVNPADVDCMMESQQTVPEIKKSNGSASSSVVVVSSPGSSFVEVDDAKTVGNRSTGSVEIVNADQLIAPDEVDETGSVVYVDTDDEEEDGHDFTFLKSWASSGSVTGSQVATSMNASQTTSLTASVVMTNTLQSGPPSLQASFHSVESELNIVEAHVAPPPVVVEAVLSVTGAEPQEQVIHQDEKVSHDNVDSQPSDSVTPERAVPVNGSSQLPVDLNAMRSVEEQEIFSPSSDIGTKFLSAASTIANAFMQSMETLSKTLGEVEAKTRASMEGRSSQSSQAPIEMEQVRLNSAASSVAHTGSVDNVDQVQADVNSTGVAAVEEVQLSGSSGQEVSRPEEADSQLERGRGHRDPPKSDGPLMSREEMDWYLEEYGLGHFGNYLWEEYRGALEREAFNKFVIEYYDGLENQD